MAQEYFLRSYFSWLVSFYSWLFLKTLLNSTDNNQSHLVSVHCTLYSMIYSIYTNAAQYVQYNSIVYTTHIFNFYYLSSWSTYFCVSVNSCAMKGQVLVVSLFSYCLALPTSAYIYLSHSYPPLYC